MAADGGDEGSSGGVGDEEMVLGAGAGEEWSGCQMFVLPVAVGSQRGRVTALESARMLASDSAAAAIGPEEACGVGGRNTIRPPPLCPSAARPHGAS